MKKLIKVLAVALVGALAVLSLAACGSSTYGKIKSAFEKEGYKESEDFKSIMAPIEKQLEDADLSVTIHILGKDITKVAMILEFKSSKELDKQLSDNETLKGMIKDAQKSNLVNGNCLLIPTLSSEIMDIFKNA